MAVPNTTYRVLVEKLGGQDSSTFMGNEGEVFYDPDATSPVLKLSNGSTPGGVSIGGDGGAGFSGDYNDLTNIIGNSGPQNIAIGQDVHLTFNYTPGFGTVAIGYAAGRTNQGGHTVAVGWQAGQISQSNTAIAIGYAAGQTSQEDGAVSIGAFAGNQFQGVDAIAIGKYAGFAGVDVAQPDNTIILNATGENMGGVPAQTNSFYVKPVRAVSGASLPSGFKPVAYNPTTGEFIYYDA